MALLNDVLRKADANLDVKMPRPKRAEDFAPPALRGIEGDIAALPKPRPSEGDHMDEIKNLMSNAVTTAHDDAGRALDKVLGEAKELVARIEKRVIEHKQALHNEGQRIALELEAAIGELHRTVSWVETQGPKLQAPKYQPPLPAPSPLPLKTEDVTAPPMPAV